MRRQATATIMICALGAAAPLVVPRLASSGQPAAAIGSADTLSSGSVGSAGAGRRERARAPMRLPDGTRVGQVRFFTLGSATEVEVSLRLPQRLAAAGGSFHGFHVHGNDVPANGNGCIADPAAPPSTWFLSADGHYSEPGKPHREHLGDLPVVYLERDGQSTATFVTDRFRPADVIGRAIIVHAQPDNYHNIPLGSAPTAYTPNSATATALTTATGNAGDRVVCGVIR